MSARAKILSIGLGFVLLFVGAVFMHEQGVLAQSTLNPICEEYDTNDDSAPAICREDADTRGETASDNSILSLLSEVIEVLLFVLGAISVIAILAGGFMYVTSTGDPSKIDKAKNTILYAIVGLVVAVLAQLIIVFVLDRI